MSIPSRLPALQHLRRIVQIVVTGAAIGGHFSVELAGADTPIETNTTVAELVAPGPVVPPTIAAPPAERDGNVGASEAEIRIAKRPWLLEKLVGPEKIESQKLDPPDPPIDLLDPPSVSRILPRPAGSAAPNHQHQSSARQPLRDPAPLRDPDSTKSEDRHPSSIADSPQVIAGDVEPPIAPAVTVRQLRIARDGSLIPTESDPATVSVEKTEDSSVNDEGERESDNYVGDLEPVEIGPESESTETASQATVDHELDHRIDQEPLDYAGYPQQPIELTHDVVRMRAMMQRCLQYYYNRPEVANARSNWGMMHSIMVYGIDTRVIVGRRRYSAIAWVAGNNVCRGQRLLTAIDDRIAAKNGVGLQGHQGQFLAVLSLVGVPADYALHADDQKFTVDDLVDAEMLACQQGEELTFTLIGLSHYLDTESQWRSADGEKWDFEKLIRSELAQPIVGAACGGSHRLMGFAHALRARRAEGRPITGQWKRAQEYVDEFQQYTYRLQNRDGSMSTDWFAGREDNGNLERKIQTTGHMVEWLLTVTPDTELQNPRLVRAIQFLLKSMYHERDTDWEIGPKGHALRSLAMYYERVYQAGPAWRMQSMAHGRQPRRR